MFLWYENFQISKALSIFNLHQQRQRKMLNVRWLRGNPRAICIRTRPRRISCISPRISPICNWDFFHLQFVFLAASHLGFVPIWYLWAQIRQFVLGHSSRGLTVWLLCTNASQPGPLALCNALWYKTVRCTEMHRTVIQSCAMHCDTKLSNALKCIALWWKLYESSLHYNVESKNCTLMFSHH